MRMLKVMSWDKLRQENRQKLDDQIRMAAGRLQLGGGTDGEDGRNAGGGAGKA